MTGYLPSEPEIRCARSDCSQPATRTRQHATYGRYSPPVPYCDEHNDNARQTSLTGDLFVLVSDLSEPYERRRYLKEVGRL